MKVAYENDPQRGAGNGILHCSDITITDNIQSFDLLRTSDRLFLSEQGWVPQGSSLQPTAQCVQGDELLLFIDSSVVNQLDTQEGYRLTLHTAKGENLYANLRVHDVLFGTDAPHDNTAKIIPQTPITPESSTKQPTNQENIQHLSIDIPIQPQAKKSSLPLILGLALLLLLVGVGAAWWFMRTPPPPPIAQEQSQPQKTKNIATPGQNPNSQQAKPSASAHTPALTVGEQVQRFFADQGRSPQAAAQLSRQLSTKNPTEQDAVFRLYYFASENGETSVLMNYAACLDPTQPAWGSIKKNAPAAWSVYEKAKTVDAAQASEAQKKLKTWLEEHAAQKDQQARLWLHELPQ